jgi:hypothetical protein
LVAAARQPGMEQVFQGPILFVDVPHAMQGGIKLGRQQVHIHRVIWNKVRRSK